MEDALHHCHTIHQEKEAGRAHIEAEGMDLQAEEVMGMAEEGTDHLMDIEVSVLEEEVGLAHHLHLLTGALDPEDTGDHLTDLEVLGLEVTEVHLQEEEVLDHQVDLGPEVEDTGDHHHSMEDLVEEAIGGIRHHLRHSTEDLDQGAEATLDHHMACLDHEAEATLDHHRHMECLDHHMGCLGHEVEVTLAHPLTACLDLEVGAGGAHLIMGDLDQEAKATLDHHMECLDPEEEDTGGLLLHLRMKCLDQ